MQGATDTEMLFDDVRIPLRDPETNNNYTLNRFGLLLYQYLRSLGVNAKRDINRWLDLATKCSNLLPFQVFQQVQAVHQ